MTGYQAILDALDQAERALQGLEDPGGKARLEAQQIALARLQACLDDGFPALDPARARSTAQRIRVLLASNGLNLKWTRLRARLARIGVPRASIPAPRAARLDLVS